MGNYFNGKNNLGSFLFSYLLLTFSIKTNNFYKEISFGETMF